MKTHLAYNATELITNLKSVIVQTPGACIIKLSRDIFYSVYFFLNQKFVGKAKRLQLKWSTVKRHTQLGSQPRWQILWREIILTNALAYYGT